MKKHLQNAWNVITIRDKLPHNQIHVDYFCVITECMLKKQNERCSLCVHF